MRLQRQPGLRGAVIALLVVPTLLLFGIGGWTVLRALETQLEQRLQEDVELIARTLREPLARSLERGRTGSLRDALRSTSQIGRVFGVYVYDDSGELVARDDRLTGVGRPTLAQLDVDGAETAATYGSMGGRAVYSYFTPLNDASGRVIGMLQVTRRAAEMQDYVAALRWNVGLATVGLSAVIILVILAGHQLAIGRPLARLGATMSRIADGDESARAPVTGPRELRWLGQRLNSMLDGIAERDRKLAHERIGQQRLEDELRSAERQAIIGRLAASVAHELGAPLSVVSGRAQRLSRREAADAATRTDVAAISASAARMETMIRRLLDFGLAYRREPAPVPVARVVRAAAALVAGHVELQGTQIEIGPGPEQLLVVADETRLRDALLHLLRNAVQAAAGGRVRMSWALLAGQVMIDVENAGIPMSDEQRQRAFEPFFTTKPDGQGSGLGLAIVKNTVADHQGSVCVDTSDLGGARLRITLPRFTGEAG